MPSGDVHMTSFARAAFSSLSLVRSGPLLAMDLHMLRNSIACLLLTTTVGMGYSTTLVEGNSRVLLGRYSTAEAEPTKALYEPLELVAQITFPREQVSTIGDAINHTLLRTGYSLVQPQSLPAQASGFLNLPLPEAQRTLGPYTVQDILDVLVGPAWKWQRDQVRRIVWFTLADAYAPRRLQPIVSPAPSTPAAVKEVR